MKAVKTKRRKHPAFRHCSGDRRSRSHPPTHSPVSALNHTSQPKTHHQRSRSSAKRRRIQSPPTKPSPTAEAYSITTSATQSPSTKAATQSPPTQLEVLPQRQPNQHQRNSKSCHRGNPINTNTTRSPATEATQSTPTQLEVPPQRQPNQHQHNSKSCHRGNPINTNTTRSPATEATQSTPTQLEVPPQRQPNQHQHNSKSRHRGNPITTNTTRSPAWRGPGTQSPKN